MPGHKKEFALFGIVAVVALVLMLFMYSRTMTGAVFVQCPEGYRWNETARGAYCVEEICWEPNVKCMVQDGLIKRPDCECWRYVDKVLCGIKGAEKTSIKSPKCTRQGHVGMICGYYDSRERMCVDE